MRSALIKIETGVVENIIVADENYAPPDGYIVVGSDSAGILDMYIDREFIPAEPTPETPPADPPTPTTTPLNFIERFTPDEQLGIVAAAMQTPALRLWYDKLMAADQVVFDDPRLIDGMRVIVEAGLITQARRDQILGL